MKYVLATKDFPFTSPLKVHLPNWYNLASTYTRISVCPTIKFDLFRIGWLYLTLVENNFQPLFHKFSTFLSIPQKKQNECLHEHPSYHINLIHFSFLIVERHIILPRTTLYFTQSDKLKTWKLKFQLVKHMNYFDLP